MSVQDHEARHPVRATKRKTGAILGVQTQGEKHPFQASDCLLQSKQNRNLSQAHVAKWRGWRSAIHELRGRGASEEGSDWQKLFLAAHVGRGGGGDSSIFLETLHSCYVVTCIRILLLPSPQVVSVFGGCALALFGPKGGT